MSLYKLVWLFVHLKLQSQNDGRGNGLKNGPTKLSRLKAGHGSQYFIRFHIEKGDISVLDVAIVFL